MADIVDNNYMKNLLKTVYEEGVVNNKAQSSPVISEMKKENWVGGKEFAYSAQYLNGGNVGSNLAQLVSEDNNYAYAVPRNAEWKMTYGALESYFDIDSPEMLASADEKGAYMSILANKMGASFDLIGKNSALYLYGGKYGVIEQLKDAINIPNQGDTATMTVSSAAGLKLQPGIRFQIASAGADNTAVPSSALLTPILTVVAIDDSGDNAVVTYTSNVTNGSTFTTYVGDFVELFGARAANSAGAEAYGFEGLYDILPIIGNRSGTAWENYIKTPFRNVNRSDYVTGLAGQFVKADSTGATRKTDALVKLLKKTQRYGGLNDIIIVNDDTLNDIYKELDSKAWLRQGTEGSTGGRKSATAGFNQFSTAFGDSFIDRVIRDPYAMNGVAYMLDKDDLTFKTISNAGKVFDAVGNGQLGKYDVRSFGDQGIGENVTSGVNYDKLFTIVSGHAPGTFDYSTRVVSKIYGNFMLKKTGASGVAVLD